MINKELLNELSKKYNKNKDNIIRERFLNKTELIDLIMDKNTSLDVEFNCLIDTHGITNQYDSGRCWIFGGLNILREKVIKKCNLNNFELSGSFLAYYDKLEKINYIINRLIELVLEGKDIYDKEISNLLNIGVEDGGYFTGFSNLVMKYGIVPKSVFKETYQSTNTGEINQILNRLIKKFYLELELYPKKHKSIKNKYIEYAYRIINNLYGKVPDKFNFEYVDRNNVYHIEKDLTPKLFYKKYININLLDEYVEVCSYEDSKYKYNNLYIIKSSSRIIGTKDNTILNIPLIDMKRMLLKQIRSKELVYFSASIPNKIINGILIDTFNRYGEIFDIDLTLKNNDILKTNETMGEHVMVFSGVNIIDNKPIKWRIENSWGVNEGDRGYFVATDDWVNKYVFNVIINKKYLNKKQKNILKTKPIIVEEMNNKF